MDNMSYPWVEDDGEENNEADINPGKFFRVMVELRIRPVNDNRPVNGERDDKIGGHQP